MKQSLHIIKKILGSILYLLFYYVHEHKLITFYSTEGLQVSQSAAEAEVEKIVQDKYQKLKQEAEEKKKTKYYAKAITDSCPLANGSVNAQGTIVPTTVCHITTKNAFDIVIDTKFKRTRKKSLLNLRAQVASRNLLMNPPKKPTMHPTMHPAMCPAMLPAMHTATHPEMHPVINLPTL